MDFEGGIEYFTIVSLFLLNIELFRIWRLQMLFHPSFYFSLIWLMSVPAQLFLTSEGIAFVRYEDSVKELNTLVLFTTICFLIIIRFGKNKKNKSHIKLTFTKNLRAYKIFVYITFFSSVFQFIYSTIAFGISLNPGLNRGIVISDEYRSRSLSIFEFIGSYGGMFLPVITICAGYYLGLKIQKKSTLKVSNWLIILPLLIYIIQVITIGGRNPLAVGIKYYLLGLGFSTTANKIINVNYKYILFGFFAFVLFNIFITSLGNQRREVLEEGDQYVELKSPVLNQFRGIMDYFSSHYWGYQLRRKDIYDSDKLGYGFYTFHGVFLISIPFSKLFGINSNFGDLIGMPEDNLDYFYLKENGYESFYTTNSIYVEMICDFGEAGIYIFIILLVIYTHRAFLKLTNKNINKSINLYFYILIFKYWSSSNFQSVYASGEIMLLFLILFTYDLLSSIIDKLKWNYVS